MDERLDQNEDNRYRTSTPVQPHGGLLSVGSSGLQTTTSLPGGLSTYPPTPSPMPPLTPMTPMTAEQAGIVPQLQNIVSTVNLGCKLDLKKIALHARNAEYNPKV